MIQIHGPRGSRGRHSGSRGLGVSGSGLVWDHIGPSGWFDETSDDSLRNVCLYISDPDFSSTLDGTGPIGGSTRGTRGPKKTERLVKWGIPQFEKFSDSSAFAKKLKTSLF